MPQDLLTEPWRRGLVAIVPANGTEDHLFESRQGVRLFTCRCKLKSSDTTNVIFITDDIKLKKIKDTPWAHSLPSQT
jgi:hypothetical protein